MQKKHESHWKLGKRAYFPFFLNTQIKTVCIVYFTLRQNNEDKSQNQTNNYYILHKC